jgi:hypothetical protein
MTSTTRPNARPDRSGADLTASDRKAAIDAYKQRTVVSGIYAVTCVPTGQRWVGAANDLSTIKNRIWFTLGLPRSPWPDLEKAWNAHGGAAAFTFEEVERLADDIAPYARDIALKERAPYWRQKLGAATI